MIIFQVNQNLSKLWSTQEARSILHLENIYKHLFNQQQNNPMNLSSHYSLFYDYRFNLSSHDNLFYNYRINLSSHLNLHQDYRINLSSYRILNPAKLINKFLKNHVLVYSFINGSNGQRSNLSQQTQFIGLHLRPFSESSFCALRMYLTIVSHARLIRSVNRT